ncbi:MAG: hypothetical protein ACR2PF_08640 [Rhizobiaceae bacterium]
MPRISAAIIPIPLAFSLAACSTFGAKRGLDDSSKPAALVLALPGNFGDTLAVPARNSLGKAEAQALNFGRAGEQMTWSATGPDVSGTVVAFQLYRVGTSNCRRFRHEIRQNGDTQSASGTACKRNGGNWQLVS